MNNNTTYAIIKIIFFDKEYTSIPLDVTNDEENEQLVQILSEQGTTHLTMFKMPTSEKSFIIFSREQLNSALFEITLIEKINKKSIKLNKENKETN